MEPWVWMVLAAAVVAIGILAVFLIVMPQQRKQRSERLRNDFGPEYDRAVDEFGDEKEAEAELQRRRKRVAKLKLRPIPNEQRQRLQQDWMANQADFVDEPASAFDRAASLVDEAMEARGYPVRGDFDERYADLSVEYGYVLNNYRDGREVAVARSEGEDVGTEDLRRAMVCYRALFTELLSNGAETPAIKREQEQRRRAVS